MAKSKRDIDKEIMFNKIMPSSLLNKQADDTSDSVSEQPVSIPAEPPKAAPSPAKAQLFSIENGIQFKDKKPTVIVNLMEKMVLERLDAAFAKFNCCKCDRCKKDVVAIALNKLKPKYIVAQQDAIPGIVPSQTSVEITTAIIQAIIIVKANPRH